MAPFSASKTPPLWVALNPLVWLFWIIDFSLWLLFPIPLLGVLKMVSAMFRGPVSTASEGEATRRSNGAKSLLRYPKGREDLNTVHKVMQYAFQEHADLKAMGTRTYEGEHTPKGAKFPLKVFSDTTWKKYADVGDEAAAFGRALLALGMQPLESKASDACTDGFQQLKGPNCLLIYEETCATWMTAAIGAMGQSIPVATSYATLGIAAVVEAINQTNAPVILCNYKDVQKVAENASQCPNLTTIVYTRNYVEKDAPEHPASIGKIAIRSFAECVELGNSSDVRSTPFHEPAPNDLGLIMYTSGSTGKPKGVMLKHSSIVASIAALFEYVRSFLKEGSSSYQETYLAYLPASHILEFAVEMGMLALGAQVGYADPKTISSRGAARKLPNGEMNFKPTGFGKKPPGAIQEFAPSVMAAVPKIWDTLKKGVESEIGKKGGVVQSIFLAAFAGRSAALEQNRTSPLCTKFFQATAGKLLGGRLKVTISGGGAISGSTQNFIRTAFGVNLVQGYGLTETCASGTVQPYWSPQDGVAGAPVASVDIRLKSCMEVCDRDGKAYQPSDKTHLGGPCMGRGEVLIRGPSVGSGYYMMADKTKSDFDEDGWFHTGDIAIWMPDGMLKIVDRLKNLVKLKGAEYIAIEAMETTYSESVFVNGINGGMMCYGDSDMDRPVALVQVNTAELKKWAAASGVVYKDIEELCGMEEARSHVCKDLNRIGKPILGRNELLAAVALISGEGSPNREDAGPTSPWTPENQFLTASNKLNRQPVLKGFASVMDELKPRGIR